MHGIVDALFSLVYPRRCPFCGCAIEHNERVCKSCLGKLPFVTGEVCRRCGRGRGFCRCASLNFEFERCVSPFYYEGLVRRGIVNFKFYARQSSASAFAFYTAKIVRREYAGEHFDFISCVPLTRAERKKRGFNQSEIFARALAKELSLPYREALAKPKDVLPQRTLSARQRWGNISGAFRALSALHGESILLADDVITTGATLCDCARALKSAGAGEVCCAAIACVRYGGNIRPQ
jgi:competence protein ComFC